jgi:hypothetical protein
MMTRSTARIGRLTAALLLSVTLLGIGAAVSAQESAATPQPVSSRAAADAIAAATGADGLLRFDVAENMAYFAWDPDLTYDDGMPAYGDSFITRGYIYPAGTLTASNGVNADGSPEFPERVLGEWVCRGWFVGQGARTATGAMVVSTQIYTFGGELGTAMIITDGYELADVGVEIARAITGGTGQFGGASGEARQTFLGFNASEGVNLQLVMALASAAS